MKHYLLIFSCLLAFSFHSSAQTNCDDKKMACCRKKKEKQQGSAVLMQTEGQKVLATANVTAINAKYLHLYLFDVEGTMVHQAVLTHKEKNTISNLKKGTYVYTVFANDESIEEGKIEIK
jgi:hypothetical protein